MDQALAEGCTVDEAEARAMEQVQKLGAEMLGVWADEKQQRCVTESQRDNPLVIKHLKHKGPAPRQIITEMDGSMVPVMQPGKGPDRGKGKTLLWREARLCMARDVQQAQGIYGATMGTADIASGVWRQTALQAGLHDQ